MRKEKLVSLTKYLDKLNNSLSSPTPAKHVGHPETYKQYLLREIAVIKAQLDAARLEGTGK